MFQTAIPAAMRSIVAEAVRGWEVSDVTVLRSGTFTIERLLAARGWALHSHDVEVYPATIGSYLAGGDAPLALRDDPDWEWLEPYLDTPLRRAATMLLSAQMTEGPGSENTYYRRQRAAFRAQWDRLHAAASEQLEHLPLRLASFEPKAAVLAGAGAPPEHGLIWVGQESLHYRGLESVFDWSAQRDPPQPDPEILQRHRHWLAVVGGPMPELGPLLGRVQTSNRAVPFHLYGDGGTVRLAGPVQTIEPLRESPLAPGEAIGDYLWLARLSLGQFNFLRSRYLDPGIAPATVKGAWAVMAGERVLGCFGFADHTDRGMGKCYLMSDFPVEPTDYPRLSKLVLMAALSKEAQQLMQRSHPFPVAELYTTAFSRRPVSMKYRGLFRLFRRRETDDPEHPYQLEYRGRAGQWTLKEALASWLTS